MTSIPTRFALAMFMLTASAVAVPAQTQVEQMLRKNHLSMLFERWKAQPWVVNGGWIYEFDDALEKAKAENKLILAYFTKASDASRSSQQIERGLFSDPEFLKRKDNAVLFSSVYTQLEGREYEDLAQTLGLFSPTVAVLDSNGKVLRDLSRNVERGVALNILDHMRDFADLTKRRADGEDDLESKIFVTECQLGIINWKQAKEKLSQLELTDAERKTVDSVILDEEIMAWLVENRSNRQVGTQAEVYGAYKAGRRPSAKMASTYFWDFLLDAAEGIGDLETYKAAHAEVMVQRRVLWDERLKLTRRPRPGDADRNWAAAKKDFELLEARLQKMIQKVKKKK